MNVMLMKLLACVNTPDSESPLAKDSIHSSLETLNVSTPEMRTSISSMTL